MSKIWFPGEDKLHQASTQGPVPLGYRCIDKKLVVVPQQAEAVVDRPGKPIPPSLSRAGSPVAKLLQTG
jgi:hypothetical protein